MYFYDQWDIFILCVWNRGEGEIVFTYSVSIEAIV